MIALVALVALAGCGGDDDDSGGEAQKTAPTSASKGTGNGEGVDAFVSCFDEGGYEEQVLPRPSNTAPLLASTKGYKVTSVLLKSDKGAFYSPFVHFFESEAKLQEAKRKLNLDFGTADVPEADERGPAVVEYTTKQARTATRDAILACLGSG